MINLEKTGWKPHLFWLHKTVWRIKTIFFLNPFLFPFQSIKCPCLPIEVNASEHSTLKGETLCRTHISPKNITCNSLVFNSFDILKLGWNISSLFPTTNLLFSLITQQIAGNFKVNLELNRELRWLGSPGSPDFLIYIIYWCINLGI